MEKSKDELNEDLVGAREHYHAAYATHKAGASHETQALLDAAYKLFASAHDAAHGAGVCPCAACAS